MFATLLGIFGEASTLHYALETFLIAAVTFLYFRRREVKDTRVKLTEKQKDELIAEWKPEPLVPDTPQDHPVLNPRFVDGKMTKYVKIDGNEYLNMVTSNFLGFVGEQRIEEVAKKTIFKYGVGSCGPRGFYGTVDVHLDLEKELAQFFGCEEAVLYSYGFATIASAIPAYAKRGDVIFVDKGVNFAIQKGLQASRARVEWFEHNDMKDLERLLELQAEKDKKDTAKAAKTRRFMVVEGIYANSGEICPLQKLMEFKWQHKVRIFIDESYSFGVLGKTGRGVTEHFNVPMIDVDMVMASLENAIASTGGFCVGRSYVVGHQRLSGLGYCFSASLPPLLATAASEAIKIIDEQPERVDRVRRNAAKVHQALEKIFSGTSFALIGAEISPLKHIQWKGKEEQAEEVLDQLVDKLFDDHSILVTRARYLVKEECFPVESSLKVMVQSELTDEEMDRFVNAVSDIVQNL